MSQFFFYQPQAQGVKSSGQLDNALPVIILAQQGQPPVKSFSFYPFHQQHRIVSIIHPQFII